MPNLLDVASAIERVARELQAERGDSPIPKDALITAVVAECGCSPTSVLPWDYCYNTFNDGLPQRAPLFEGSLDESGTAQFKYLGRDYPYTGGRYHTPSNRKDERRKVGDWLNGVFTPSE